MSCIKHSLLLLLFLWALPVLAQTSSPPERIILILGDSLSVAYDKNPNQGWVNLLRHRLMNVGLVHYKVVNISAVHNTTKDGLRVLPSALQRYRPAIVVLELGSHDRQQHVAIQIIQQRLKTMIQLAQQSKATVILLAIKPSVADLTDMNKMFQKLAYDLNVALIPNFLQGTNEKKLLQQPENFYSHESFQMQLLNNMWDFMVPALK